MPHTYEHPRPSVTVDCAVFGFDEGELRVLLVERGVAPFEGSWALPGGFVHMDESLEDAARRELREETGLERVYLEQLRTFGRPDRDPRGRVISIAWYALVRTEGHRPVAATDARRAQWHRAASPPPLAFDHAEILECALQRLRAKVRYEPVGFELLPRRFTLPRIQHLYETLLGHPLDKRNFRKKLLAMELLDELDAFETGVGHRPARLYSFNRPRYERLRRQGFDFDI